MKQKKLKQRIAAVCMAGTLICSGIPVNVFAENPTKQVEETPEYPFMDTSLSFEERAVDIVSRLTLEEKIALLTARRPEGIVGIPRLGIEPWSWGGEANHGLSWVSPKISSFPTGNAMSSSWNRELIQEAADAISDEARGMRALIQETNNPNLASLSGGALSFWAPTMNLSRDPRWGRADECYGEDTYLTAELAGSFVNGMQGDDEKYLKTVPCLKHFLANNCEANRYNGNSEFDERTLKEYYAKTFQDIVENTGISQIMTSYNRVNGIPMSANKEILDTMLRKTWGFDGMVVTDCGAIDMMVNRHKWVPEGWDHSVTSPEAVALAIDAGTDINCGYWYRNHSQAAIDQGLMKEEDLDRGLIRAFTERMKTGEFDPDEMVEYTKLTKDELGSAEHVVLTEKVADESVVMLKNEDILPLNGKDVDSVVLVGDRTLTQNVELGGYAIHTPIHQTSPLQGLQDKLNEVNPDAVVTAVNPQAAAATTPYLFNIDKFILTTKTGETIEVEAESASELVKCVNEGANIGFVEPSGSYVRFTAKNIDLSTIEKITVRASCHPNAMGGIVECQYGTPNFQPSGKSLASTEVTSTGNWNIWQNFEMEMNVGDEPMPENGDLYFVFKNNLSGSLSEAEEKTIRESDVAVVYVGTIEGTDAREDLDRGSINLPRQQAELVQAVQALNPNTIVYIQSVAQVNVESFKNDVPAILWTGYNGQEQGKTMANILFGDVNPSGRLNYTWYQDESQLASITDYRIRSTEDSYGRTYQYFKGDVSYPFGYGLSYTDFEYSNLTIDKTNVTPNDSITVTVDVKNTGAVTGKEVPQLYVTSPNAAENERPVKRLRGFDKVELKPGEKQTVTFEVPMDELYFWDEDGDKREYDLGEYTVEVGASSEDIRVNKTFEMSGALDVKLNVITAEPERFIFDMDKGVVSSEIEVTANMNDESFYDVKDTEIAYESSNTDVAKVSKNGKIQAVGAGLATITVSVTVDGVTKSVDFPVAVRRQTSLENIFVNGKSLTGFQPDKKSYVCVVEGTEVPEITAEAPEGLECKIQQAEGVPGTAIVTLMNGAEKIRYTIQFVNIPVSTDFTKGEVDGDVWTIKDENAANWKVDEKGLTISTEKGDIYGSQGGLKNLFLQEVPGDWTLNMKVDFSTQPNQSFQQGAILIYQDDDNFVKVTCEGNSGSSSVKMASEIGGSPQPDNTTVSFSGRELYYRVVKEGDKYTAWFSMDGKDYKSLGSKTASLKNPKLGLMATNSNQYNAPSIDVTYEYAKFSTGEVKCTCGLYDLEFAGKTLTLPAEEKLEATAKVRGGCLMEGHADTDVVYDFAIEDGALNTAEAVMEDGVLKAVKEGLVEVTVTASLHEAQPISASAVFEMKKEEEKTGFTITVDGKSETYDYNDEVTIKAPVKDGCQFAGWKVDGEIVSYKETYKFYVSRDMTFEATYVPDTETVKEDAKAMLSNIFVTKRDDGKSDVKFVGELVLPEGYKVLEAGLVWSSKDDTELIVDGGLNKDLKPTHITKISDTNQFSVTIKGMPEDRFLRGVIFAKVASQDGKATYIFSTEEKVYAAK